MDDIDDFPTFYELADHIITNASKEDAAEAARLARMTERRFRRVSSDDAMADRPSGHPLYEPIRPGCA
jgi:hypothetical protein